MNITTTTSTLLFFEFAHLISSNAKNNDNNNDNTNFTETLNVSSSTITTTTTTTTSERKNTNANNNNNNNNNTRTQEQNHKTILLMSDSRSLDVDDYHKLAYTINAHYANLHGYQIRYVHTPCITTTLDDHNNNTNNNTNTNTKECISCIHPKFGERMSPWCKVKAINDTFHRYCNDSDSSMDRLVYIDSDAFVNKIEQPLPSKYFTKTLNMFANEKEVVPCSGIQFWQMTDTAKDMIQAWWDSSSHQTHFYNTHHDYEQSVFHTKSEILREYWNEIGIIREGVREFSRESSRGFFRHITKKTNQTRYQRMKAFIERNHIL